LIQEHTAESVPVTQSMAALVMERTPEATVSLAITGHLGPGADETKDGLVFVRIFRRYPDRFDMIGSGDFQLRTRGRIERQTEATWRALLCLDQTLGEIEI
jgi:nicotinamide-nucleotide amidase